MLCNLFSVHFQLKWFHRLKGSSYTPKEIHHPIASYPGLLPPPHAHAPYVLTEHWPDSSMSTMALIGLGITPPGKHITHNGVNKVDTVLVILLNGVYLIILQSQNSGGGRLVLPDVPGKGSLLPAFRGRRRNVGVTAN